MKAGSGCALNNAAVSHDIGAPDVALVRRTEGVVRETPFEHPDDEAHRAWAAIAGDWSPNAYVIDISGGRTLTHHIAPRDASQRPA